jgi:hypothetical protein
MMEFHDLLKTVRRLKFLYLLKYKDPSESSGTSAGTSLEGSEIGENDEYADYEPSPNEVLDAELEQQYQTFTSLAEADREKRVHFSPMVQVLEHQRGDERKRDNVDPFAESSMLPQEMPAEDSPMQPLSDIQTPSTEVSTSATSTDTQTSSERREKKDLHKYVYSSPAWRQSAGDVPTPKSNSSRVSSTTSGKKEAPRKGPITPQEQMAKLLRDYKPSPYDKLQQFTFSDRKVSSTVQRQISLFASTVKK